METDNINEIKDLKSESSVSIDPKTIVLDDTQSDMEIKVKFVNPVNHSSVPARFGFEDYLEQAVKGEISLEKHDEFLHIIYEPYKRLGGVRNGFWWGTDTEDHPKNLIETYSNRFTDCFGERGRNLVTSPTVVREIVNRIRINGVAYHDYYNLNQINKMNYLEVVCEIIENLSRGEIAKSFASRNHKHIFVTYQPEGKDYMNVYLPVSAAPDYNFKSALVI